jgi:hypothetical protein
MRGILLTTFLLAILAVTFVPVKPASAFKSYPAPNVHDWIVHDAFAEFSDFGFSGQALDRVKYADRNVDWNEMNLQYFLGIIPLILEDPVPNANYNGAHHFDRNTEATTQADLQSQSKTAFINGALYIQQQRAWFLGNLTVCTDATRNLGLDALGRALHALADFFAHSNFVDLSLADQAAALNALNDPSLQPPNTLELCYSPPWNQTTNSPEPASYDRFPHNTYDGVPGCNLDSATSTAKAENKLNGVSEFTLAYNEAVAQTAGFVSSCKQQLNNDTLWNKKVGDPTVPEVVEIPVSWYPLYYSITDSVAGAAIPDATVNVYFANGTSFASFATDYGGITGWYLPQETYYYQVSAPGYQPYSSSGFVLNTAMVYLNISLTPVSVGSVGGVGGIVVPIDKLTLLALLLASYVPLIGIASTATIAAAVATAIYVRRRRKKW